MKRMKTENLDLRAIVESELEKCNCDGLYSPCCHCEHGCSRTELFSCGEARADCRPGLQHPGTSDLEIVSYDEYCEIAGRIEAEHRRLEEKRRLETAAKKKAERLEAERLEAKRIKDENVLKKKKERLEKRKQFAENIRTRFEKVIAEISGAVRTSILCKLLSGVSVGSLVFSVASIIFFELIKNEWMASAAKAEALAAVYLFQKLFMFEAIYVFVIVTFTIALISIRIIRGDYRADYELDQQTEIEEEDDRFFL